MPRSKSTGGAAPIVDGGVFSPLPIGSRDLLPATARRRRAVTDALLAVFERWGYREVIPPLIEYFEVHGRGLAPDERERCVRFIEAGTGELVALRSDVTPQIARMVAQRVGGTVGEAELLRLCYAATLVRLPRSRHEPAELHQVGVELVGEGRAHADAELIGLADEALAVIGSRDHRFDLAHTGVVRRLLAALGLPPGVELELRSLLARKDRSALVRLLAGQGVAPTRVDAFASLCDLHGPPRLLRRARRTLRSIDAAVVEAIDDLAKLIDTVEREHPGVGERLSVDLGQARGFHYYTGLRVRVWAPGCSGPVVRGGRYDEMLARYGAAVPATGLAFDLDALEQALASVELDEDRPAAHLVATSRARTTKTLGAKLREVAVGEARRVRGRGLRAWIDDGLTLEQAHARAEGAGAERLTWFKVEGRGANATIERERWRLRSGGWRRER